MRPLTSPINRPTRPPWEGGDLIDNCLHHSPCHFPLLVECRLPFLLEFSSSWISNPNTPHHDAAATCHHCHPTHCRIRQQGALHHGAAQGLTVLLNEGCHHCLSSPWLGPAQRHHTTSTAATDRMWGD
jgi:hypothetical protein